MFVLGQQQVTLAEVLRDQGYATAAAIGAFPLSSQFGLDQGFELYDDHIAQYEDLLGQKVMSKSRLFFDERKAARVNDAVFPWLEENSDQPFFLWVHYYDPHEPHEPPPPYNDLYLSDLYDGEIAYSDESFGTLIERLRKLGVYDRTLLVFASDHGEGLGEHDELTHSYLAYNSTLRVPLIMRAPGGARGAVIDSRVGTVDIVPTVLEFLGVHPPDGIQGRSLVSEVRDGTDPGEDGLLYAETLSSRLAQGWGELRVLYDGSYKYIHGPRPELFDIREDPNEIRDLAASKAQVAVDLRQKLQRFLDAESDDTVSKSVEMSAETRRRLEALGYIQGGDPDASIEEKLLDGGLAPQDRVEVVNDLSAAKVLFFRHQYAEGGAFARKLLVADPGNPSLLEMVANAELNLGRYDEAARILEEMTQGSRAGPVTPALLRGLGVVRFRQGNAPLALDLVRQSIELEDSATSAHLEAMVLQTLGRMDESHAAFLRALELDAAFIPARLDLAVHHAKRGDRQQAAAVFERVLTDDPYFARSFYNYGAFLVESEQLEEAAEQFQRAIALDPGYLQAHLANVAVNLALGRDEVAQASAIYLERSAPGSVETQKANELKEQFQ